MLPIKLNTLTEVIDFIALVDTSKEFANELAIIKRTTYWIKSNGDLWPDYSTTWGPYKVALANNYFTWNSTGKTGNLIHEAVHQMDYISLGSIKFWIKYLWNHIRLGYKDNEFEIKARIRQQEWVNLLHSKGYYV